MGPAAPPVIVMLFPPPPGTPPPLPVPGAPDGSPADPPGPGGAEVGPLPPPPAPATRMGALKVDPTLTPDAPPPLPLEPLNGPPPESTHTSSSWPGVKPETVADTPSPVPPVVAPAPPAAPTAWTWTLVTPAGTVQVVQPALVNDWVTAPAGIASARSHPTPPTRPRVLTIAASRNTRSSTEARSSVCAPRRGDLTRASDPAIFSPESPVDVINVVAAGERVDRATRQTKGAPLQADRRNGAGDGNRTRVLSLGS